VSAGALRIDLAARRVERSGVLVHLTPKEWGVVATLVRSPGHLVTQGDLLRQVWGAGYEGESEYLRTVLLRVRRKLEEDPSSPRHFITESGVGYRFEP
jgi:two-component system KDP operon response regulator KdpE